jgi:hypothetical protein
LANIVGETRISSEAEIKAIASESVKLSIL